MRYLFVLMIFSGCAVAQPKLVDIDYSIPPPSDWPKLEERITMADLDTIRRWCNVPKNLKDRIVSCATISFTYGLCMIYLSDDDPETLTHERAHCAGYGHVGEAHKPAQAWRQWKSGAKVDVTQ